jgi:hypothetical protein
LVEVLAAAKVSKKMQQCFNGYGLLDDFIIE